MTNLYPPELIRPTSASNVRHFTDFSDRRIGRIDQLLIKIIAVEFLANAGACFFTGVVYFNIVLKQWPPTGEYLLGACMIAALAMVSALGSKQYVSIQGQPLDRYLWSGMAAVSLAFSVFLSLLFLFKVSDSYSRGTFFSQFVAVTAAALITRSAIHSYVCRAVKSGEVEARRAVLVGEVKANDDLLRSLAQFGIRWAGVLRLPDVHGKPLPGLALCSPSIRSFVERCRAFKPDDIVFLAAPSELTRVALLIDALSELPVTVHIVPTGVNEIWGSAAIADFGGVPTIQVLRPPLSAVDLAIKRIFDIGVAGLGLILSSPFLLLVALAIKLDSAGPALFRQNRHGYNNDVIPVIKFRTMSVIEDGQTTTTFTQVKTNDTRVTRLGRLLRRTNIDELPQLINVLRGEMSIVGPRPHPIALNAMFQERITPFSRRHNVKPGITGWAQVHGFRGETDTLEKMQQRIEYDLHYIDNWSFLLDLKIIVMTLFSKIAYTNAC